MSLPDTAALQALILVAQTGSISATAQLMGRTHSAVSRKIKGLEARLGFRLTQPAGRGIMLTPRAIAYADEIAPLLTAIDQAGRSGSMVDGTLTVSVAPGFAASWLIHRLQAFSGLHPGIHLRLTTPRGYGDVSDPADIYITFAHPSQMPADARRLFDVGFFPVLAPRLLDHIDPRDPGSLAGLPILHLDSAEDWIAWIATAGGSAASVKNGHVFSVMHFVFILVSLVALD